MKEFSYQSLDLSKKEIRLLVLDPSGKSDQVSGQMIHSTFLSTPEQLGRESDRDSGYEALSYEWGQSPDPSGVVEGSQSAKLALSKIYLDGKQFDVRWNLYCALRQLRLPEKHRILWCDAVCIDQTDNRERNHQVNLMRMIYTQADRVIVWLGNSLAYIKSHRSNPLRRMKDFTEYVLGTPRSQQEDKKLWSDSGVENVELKYLSVWHGFPSLSYWSRLVSDYFLSPMSRQVSAPELCFRRQVLSKVTLTLLNRLKAIFLPFRVYTDCEIEQWIIQEFVLAKDLVLYLGEETVDLEVLHKFCAGIDHLSTQKGWINQAWLSDFCHKTPFQLYRHRTGQTAPDTGAKKDVALPLLDLVCLYGESKCMDLRDRVFGLHSLAPECCRDSTPVDYSASLYKTCAKLLGHYLHEHHHGVDQNTSDDDQFSRLPEMCQSMHCILAISRSDCLKELALGEFRLPVYVKMTGNIVGTVCSDASGLPPGIFKSTLLIKHSRRHAVTLKILNHIWNLSGGYGLHQWAGKGKIPASLQTRGFVVPSLTFHSLPKLLEIPDLAKLRTKLDSERKEYEQRRQANHTRGPRPQDDTEEECEPFTNRRRFSQPLSNMQSFDSCIDALVSDGTSNSRPFYCSSGLIGHSYGEVKEGDVVCAFRGSAIVVALRFAGTAYEVSGIGWISFNRVGRDAMGSDRSHGTRLRDHSPLDFPAHFLFSVQILMFVAAFRF